MKFILFLVGQKGIVSRFSNVVFVGCVLMFVLACRFLGGSSSSAPTNSAADEKQNGFKTEHYSNADSATADKYGLCENAYYPIGEKIERRYRIVYQGGAISPKEYAQTYSDLAADKFTEHNKFSDVQNAINFQCTADGLQGFKFDNGNSISMGNNMRGKLETVKSEGLTFPAESRWRVGEKWTGNYTVHFQMQMGAANASGASVDATIDGTSEIVGEESVTVAAGTFQTFKVQTKTAFRYTSVKVNGASVPMNQTITINTTSWYAKNVGMVKSEMTGAVGGATTELLSINNP